MDIKKEYRKLSKDNFNLNKLVDLEKWDNLQESIGIILESYIA